MTRRSANNPINPRLTTAHRTPAQPPVITNANRDPADWTTPKPLTDALDGVPDIDVGHLFSSSIAWAGRYAKAVANQIQVSPLLVAPTMLSVASIAATGACCFTGRAGHQEVPVLWHLTLAPPGERKSATLKTVMAPLRSSTVESRADTDADHRVNPAIPSYRPTAILAMDVSRAALYEQVVQHHDRMAILSDEDYVVSSLAKSGAEGLDLYLKGWSGDSFSKMRKGEETVVRHPNIVVSLVVQPDVAQVAIGNNVLRGRGFPQRFLYTVAPAVTDRSYLDAKPVPGKLTTAWDRAISSIAGLARRHDQRQIGLNAGAMRRYAQIVDRLDAERQSPDRDRFEQEWLAKAHGQVLRIAGILALLRDAQTRTITETEVRAAETWVDLSLAHLGALLRSAGGGDLTARQAQRVLNWIQQQRQDVVSESSITQALRGPGFETVAAWRPVFALLVEKGWLRHQRLDAGGAKGGRPSYGYAVNPALHLGTLAA
jgi:hypothetical protein